MVSFRSHYVTIFGAEKDNILQDLARIRVLQELFGNCIDMLSEL